MYSSRWSRRVVAILDGKVARAEAVGFPIRNARAIDRQDEAAAGLECLLTGRWDRQDIDKRNEEHFLRLSVPDQGLGITALIGMRRCAGGSVAAVSWCAKRHTCAQLGSFIYSSISKNRLFYWSGKRCIKLDGYHKLDYLIHHRLRVPSGLVDFNQTNGRQRILTNSIPRIWI